MPQADSSAALIQVLHSGPKLRAADQAASDRPWNPKLDPRFWTSLETKVGLTYIMFLDAQVSRD